ncbi:SGNH/GDSL hydrolase family protein [Aestuariivivens insulae]|uniref:SGNH/GDSL hydrolase family protein n=1 Tax=Aestuariivivens insulae TaxID=1621988 RepID=UPI001F5606F5|nr:SGNH/GDSL hydrolase family protein [Aestuariivivens insulae]
MFNFSHAQDWPNLKRYQMDNAALNVPQPGEHRVVFMGNSITEQWLNIRPQFFSDKSYINRGIGGQTTPQMLLRFRQDVINLKPAVVVILAGTNDIAGNTGPSTIEMIEGNIISMVELAKANNIEVVLCSVLPVYKYPWSPVKNPDQIIIALNRKLQAYAQASKIVYVDYFSAMVNNQNGLKKELGEDGVHPNRAGYLVMEPIVKRGITKALKQN